MKKILPLFLMVLLVVTVSACGQKVYEDQEKPTIKNDNISSDNLSFNFPYELTDRTVSQETNVGIAEQFKFCRSKDNCGYLSFNPYKNSEEGWPEFDMDTTCEKTLDAFFYHSPYPSLQPYCNVRKEKDATILSFMSMNHHDCDVCSLVGYTYYLSNDFTYEIIYEADTSSFDPRIVKKDYYDKKYHPEDLAMDSSEYTAFLNEVRSDWEDFFTHPSFEFLKEYELLKDFSNSLTFNKVAQNISDPKASERGSLDFDLPYPTKQGVNVWQKTYCKSEDKCFEIIMNPGVSNKVSMPFPKEVDLSKATCRDLFPEGGTYDPKYTSLNNLLNDKYCTIKKDGDSYVVSRLIWEYGAGINFGYTYITPSYNYEGSYWFDIDSIQPSRMEREEVYHKKYPAYASGNNEDPAFQAAAVLVAKELAKDDEALLRNPPQAFLDEYKVFQDFTDSLQVQE